MHVSEKFYKRFKINTFKGRLRFWFVCFTIVVIFAAAIPFFWFGKSYLKENATVNIDKALDMQQVFISTWLDNKLAEITAISQLPSLQEDRLKAKQEVLDAYGNNHHDFNELAIINSRGTVIASSHSTIGINLSDREYYEKAKNGEAYITDVMLGRRSKQPVVIVSAPITDEEGEFNGLIFGTIPILTINAVVSEYVDADRETYIVNREGMLISESRQAAIGEYLHTELIDLAHHGEKTDEFYKDNTGENVIGDYRWVHNDQWMLIGETSESIINQPFYRIMVVFAFVLFLIISIEALLVILISNRVEAPIKNVLEGARKIGAGNWDYRLQPTQDMEVEEFRELNDNFNHMARLIEEYIKSRAKSEERYHLIAEYSSDMITIHDEQGKYLYISPAGIDMLQYRPEEIINQAYDKYIHPDDREMLDVKHQTLLQHTFAVRTYRIRRKDGKYLWVESSVRALEADSDGEKRLIVISRNITERKQIEENLELTNKVLLNLSTTDSLTGALNRRSFDEQMKEEWKKAQQNQAPLSLLMLDIDFFKPYNDTYGHLAGDECLKKVTAIIRSGASYPEDMVFRYGGEEFTVILPDTDARGAQVVAEKIRKRIEAAQLPHLGSKISDIITISVGAATTIPQDDMTIPDLIETADQALYHAKESGRNQIKTKKLPVMEGE